MNLEALTDKITDHYVKYAWANGDKILQNGRWGQIKHSMDSLEKQWPGMTAEVMARLQRLRRESSNGSTAAPPST